MTRDRLSVQQAAATLGVILSVVFVGYEIRQNTRVARATANVSPTQLKVVAPGLS